MIDRTAVSVGNIKLKNPLICASGEHVMDSNGIRAALKSGVAAVVAKSTNETVAARDQIKKADYLLLDENWNVIAPDAPSERAATFICRSGLTPQSFQEWLAMVVEMDNEARAYDAYVIASIVLADLDAAVLMSQQIEQAGIRILELNVGTPYGDEVENGCVPTERSSDRIETIVGTVRKAIKIPLWVKITGQSEHVDQLVLAARRAGADSVVVPGRFMGMIPDLETQRPYLDTNVGVGGYWNLPLTCYWLAQIYCELQDQYLDGQEAFPLVGTNGARSGEDVLRFLLAGASAVEMASAVLSDGTQVLSAAIKRIEDYLQVNGTQASRLIGKAAKVKKFAEMPDQEKPWKQFVRQ